MKILVIAYACNPFHGSESGVGWEWLRMISKDNHVDVITASFEKGDIENWTKNNPKDLSNVNFHYPKIFFWHYHKRSRIWLWIENSPFKIIMNWSYRLWQNDAYKIAQKIYSDKEIELCHLITYVGFRFPGKFYKLDCPFVWGPVGGLENTPWHLLKLLGPYGHAYYAVRNIINNFDKKFLKNPKQAFKKASLSNSIIAATAGMQKEIFDNYKFESTVICETGPPRTTNSINSDICLRSGRDKLHICWSGTHTDGKALPLLLDALHVMPNRNWHLNILGSGPRSKSWKKEVKKLGLDELCKFHGNLPRDNALNIMKKSHLFVITSLKDLTSTVLLEALSLSIPVIAPDHCGFSNVITENCGVKIPIHDINNFKKGLSNAILSLQLDEQRRLRMAKNAAKRSEELSWDKKYEKLQTIYKGCLDR